MKEAMVAPAPGRMPTMVPITEQRSIVHLIDQISLKEGIFVLTLPPEMPSSAERRFFFGSVCLKTSVTANRPISTGIMSMPASRLRLPKVRRCTAYILS